VLSVDLGFFFLSCTIFIVLQGGILGVSCALLSSRVGCCLLSAFVIVYIVIVCLPSELSADSVYISHSAERSIELDDG